MKDSNWPYLAGLIDGEGCFSISKQVNNYNNKGRNDYIQYGFRLSVTNTSLKLMKYLIEHFGGVYYTKRSNSDNWWKTSYEWRPKGRGNSERILLATLPYMVVKQEQAKLALLYVRLPEQDPDSREKLFNQMRLLNQKGSPPTTNTSSPSIEGKIESDLTSDRECAPVVIQDA
jgi:hypothetical protein